MLNYTDTKSPWEQQPDELPHWFQRFDKYARSLGKEFTVERAYRLYRTDNRDVSSDGLSLWRDYAIQYDWQRRAAEWADNEAFLRIRTWEERRQKLAEADWDSGHEMRAKALEFLGEIAASKESRRFTDQKGQIVVVKKVTVTAAQVAQLAKVGSDLQRLSVGEPTQNVNVKHEGVGIYLPETEEADDE